MTSVALLIITAVLVITSWTNFTGARTIRKAGNCMQFLSSATIRSSWQSSNFGDSLECFKGRSSYRQDDAEFFKSKVGSQFLDHGYHWLVIQLKKPVVMTSLTVKAIESPDSNLIGGATGIEVWTGELVIDFGADHCNAKTISLQFNETAARWKKCGVTSRSESGFEMTVLCADFWSASTQMILMRKQDMQENTPMNFVNLWIGWIDAKIRFDPQRLVSVSTYDTSMLNVTCSDRCGQALTVCHPDGSCAAGGVIAKPTVGIGDSGRYSCRFRGHSVAERQLEVLYPPKRIAIERRQSKVVDGYLGMAFALVTSISNPRQPRHTCGLILDDPDVLIHRCIAETAWRSRVISEGCSSFDSDETRGSMTSHWIVRLPLPALLSAIPVVCMTTAASDRRHGGGSGGGIIWSKSVNYTLEIGSFLKMRTERENSDNGGLTFSGRLAGMSTVILSASGAGVLVLVAVTALVFVRRRQRHTVFNTRGRPPRRGRTRSRRSTASRSVSVVSEQPTYAYHGETMRSQSAIRSQQWRKSGDTYVNFQAPIVEEDNIYDQLMTIAPAAASVTPI